MRKPPGVILYSASFTKDIDQLLDRAQKLGLEGLIGKRAGSKYEAGKRTVAVNDSRDSRIAWLAVAPSYP